MATMKGKQSEPLSPKVADRLLDLLSTDNEFRRLIKKDPQAAFIQAGYKPSKELAAWLKLPPVRGKRPPLPPNVLAPPWMCCNIDRIAPKAQITAARSQLKAGLTLGMSQSPIALSAEANARKLAK
ncbi:MAG: putative modified peptide [Xanthomonadaceae bacterium]|mgnify:CR=1 FL=1|nr:putative modified peptide [Xanthomonadaceae bacterium]